MRLEEPAFETVATDLRQTLDEWTSKEDSFARDWRVVADKRLGQDGARTVAAPNSKTRTDGGCRTHTAEQRKPGNRFTDHQSTTRR